MGCCFGRPTGPNSPYLGTLGGASASGRAIHVRPTTAGTSTVPDTADGENDNRDSAPASAAAAGGTSRCRRRPLSQHINKPLHRHEWTSRPGDRAWTRAALGRERAEFFDTRVGGRSEIWLTLRAALEVLWASDPNTSATAKRRRNRHDDDHDHNEGDDTEDDVGGEGPSEEDDPAVALATAQSILQAADITVPTGDLAQGAYDALGNYYPLPEHVVSDPINVQTRTVSPLGKKFDAKECRNYEDDDDDDETAEGNDAEEEAMRRREEKGKAVLDVRNQVKLRARLSDGRQDVVLSVGKAETVRSIARRIAEEAGLSAVEKVRIAYMGKILKEGLPLLAQDWKTGHVINALVLNR